MYQKLFRAIFISYNIQCCFVYTEFSSCIPLSLTLWGPIPIFKHLNPSINYNRQFIQFILFSTSVIVIGSSIWMTNSQELTTIKQIRLSFVFCHSRLSVALYKFFFCEEHGRFWPIVTAPQGGWLILWIPLSRRFHTTDITKPHPYW